MSICVSAAPLNVNILTVDKGGGRWNFYLRPGGLVENFSPAGQDLRPPGRKLWDFPTV